MVTAIPDDGESRAPTAVLALCGAVVIGLAGATVWDRVTSAPPSGRDGIDLPLIDVRGLPTLGKASASVVAIEYSDFECPACGAFARDELKPLEDRYVSSGKVQFVFHYRPLTAIHPSAVRAAEAARCADLQGQFWPMHDYLFRSQDQLEDADLRRYAAQLRLDTGTFTRCPAIGTNV